MTPSGKSTIGVDPGTRETGVVSLDHRGHILAGCLIIWEPHDTWLTHATEILDTVISYRLKHWDGLDGMVHVEDVVAPSPHLGVIDPSPLLGVAKIIGRLVTGLERERLQYHLIRPGGHGKALLASYPKQLIGDQETVGTGKLRHLRSAYDVALAEK